MKGLLIEKKKKKNKTIAAMVMTTMTMIMSMMICHDMGSAMGWLFFFFLFLCFVCFPLIFFLLSLFLHIIFGYESQTTFLH